MIIEKKVLDESFIKILSGQKTYELRLADWKCSTGDVLILKEVDEHNEYTGREIRKKIGWVGKVDGSKYWSQQDIDKYGMQVISLLPEEKYENN